MDKNTINKLLKDTSQDELIEIISSLVSHSTRSEEWLLNYCKQKGDSFNKSLIAKNQIQHYWNEAKEIISLANEYGGTYNEDDAYDALSMINDLCNEAKTDWEFRQRIVDEMMEQFYLGNSGFDDALVDSCMVLCQNKDEMLYLAPKLCNGGEYYAGVAANIFLDCGKEDEYLRIRQANLNCGEDFIELADYLITKNQYNDAIKLVEDALKSANGNMDNVYEWLFKKYAKKKQEDKIMKLYRKSIEKECDVDVMVELMYHYYKDNHTEKKKYLLKMIEVCKAKNIRKWFDECKEVLSKEDFQEHAAHLYSVFKERNLRDYLKLKIEEGNLEEVLNELQNPSTTSFGYNIDCSHELSKQLAEAYPMEICELYWKECEKLCCQSDKYNYINAVNVLKEIHFILKKHQLSNEWNTRFADFLNRHRKKRILMGYIKEEKFS